MMRLLLVACLGLVVLLMVTSGAAGKTSLVKFLAQILGHRFVRINNHEHTDIQEYIGSYTSDAEGELVFRHGVLAEAMQTGSWVVLDELDLAARAVLAQLRLQLR